MQMLPRLVKGIYWMQVNCITDLGIRYPLLSLIVPSGYPEGQLLRAFSKLLVFFRFGFHFVIVWISGACTLQSTASGSASWVGYLDPAHCVERRIQAIREPTRFRLVTAEEDARSAESLAHYLQFYGGEVGLQNPSLDTRSTLTAHASVFSSKVSAHLSTAGHSS